MNVAVLDLQPAWGIAQAYPPDSDFEELDPGGEPLVIPLKASLPEGYASGVDTLKVLATVKPTSFRQLTLPRLDQPIPHFHTAESRPRGSPGATAGCRECGSAAEPRRLRRHQARPGVGLRQGAGSNRGEAEMIVAEIDGLRCGRRISTTYQASMLDGPPIRLSLHDRLGACLGISIQVKGGKVNWRHCCSNFAR